MGPMSWSGGQGAGAPPLVGMALPVPALTRAGGAPPLVAAWFEENSRDLPWRSADRTPWGVLVSEVMLQQTPVARVVPAWTTWMARWPSPAALAGQSPGEAVRQWDRLGYPRRALNLHAASLAIVDRHDGRVPEDEVDLRALPGVGEYTAAAVLAFAFGRRSVVRIRTSGGCSRGWSMARSCHRRA